MIQFLETLYVFFKGYLCFGGKLENAMFLVLLNRSLDFNVMALVFYLNIRTLLLPPPKLVYLSNIYYKDFSSPSLVKSKQKTI